MSLLAPKSQGLSLIREETSNLILADPSPRSSSLSPYFGRWRLEQACFRVVSSVRHGYHSWMACQCNSHCAQYGNCCRGLSIPKSWVASARLIRGDTGGQDMLLTLLMAKGVQLVDCVGMILEGGLSKRLITCSAGFHVWPLPNGGV